MGLIVLQSPERYKIKAASPLTGIIHKVANLPPDNGGRTRGARRATWTPRATRHAVRSWRATCTTQRSNKSGGRTGRPSSSSTPQPRGKTHVDQGPGVSIISLSVAGSQSLRDLAHRYVWICRSFPSNTMTPSTHGTRILFVQHIRTT